MYWCEREFDDILNVIDTYIVLLYVKKIYKNNYRKITPLLFNKYLIQL